MLALYIIFGVYFAVCIVCSVVVGFLPDGSECMEEVNERASHTDGHD